VHVWATQHDLAWHCTGSIFRLNHLSLTNIFSFLSILTKFYLPDSETRFISGRSVLPCRTNSAPAIAWRPTGHPSCSTYRCGPWWRHTHTRSATWFIVTNNPSFSLNSVAVQAEGTGFIYVEGFDECYIRSCSGWSTQESQEWYNSISGGDLSATRPRQWTLWSSERRFTL
jgi:hypothetical protein